MPVNLVIVVNYTVQDGKSNWLEGMVLMCLYVILALVFWYYPGTSSPLVSGRTSMLIARCDITR